jgi:hypothetical protein
MSPSTPRAGKPFSVAVRVADEAGKTLSTGRVECQARLGRRQLNALRRGFTARLLIRGPVARCTWRLPRNSAGKTLKGAITVRAHGATARKTFSKRVGR